MPIQHHPQLHCSNLFPLIVSYFAFRSQWPLPNSSCTSPPHLLSSHFLILRRCRLAVYNIVLLEDKAYRWTSCSSTCRIRGRGGFERFWLCPGCGGGRFAGLGGWGTWWKMSFLAAGVGCFLMGFFLWVLGPELLGDLQQLDSISVSVSVSLLPSFFLTLGLPLACNFIQPIENSSLDLKILRYEIMYIFPSYNISNSIIFYRLSYNPASFIPIWTSFQ